MHQQHQRAIAWTFVDVGNAQNAKLGVMGLVGEVR